MNNYYAFWFVRAVFHQVGGNRRHSFCPDSLEMRLHNPFWQKYVSIIQNNFYTKIFPNSLAFMHNNFLSQVLHPRSPGRVHILRWVVTGNTLVCHNQELKWFVVIWNITQDIPRFVLQLPMFVGARKQTNVNKNVS